MIISLRFENPLWSVLQTYLDRILHYIKPCEMMTYFKRCICVYDMNVLFSKAADSVIVVRDTHAPSW